LNDSTFLGLPLQTWEFINTFAPWLSAAATICAVVLSLYLAFIRNRPKLRVRATHVVIVEQGGMAPYPSYVLINVVNVGDKRVRVTGIGWEFGVWRWKGSGVQLPNIDNVSNKVPLELEQGQEGNWFIPSDNWCDGIARKFLLPHWRWNLVTMRVWVSTAAGLTFRSRVRDKFLRQKLTRHCRTINTKGF
jgi:hypothetical protein